MKKLLILPPLLAALLLASCSSDEPSITEKAAEKVDQINTENADRAVQAIKTPIDKARLTKGLGDQRTDAIDEAMKNR